MTGIFTWNRQAVFEYGSFRRQDQNASSSSFFLFPAGKPTPKYIRYLGKVLPGAVFGLLVIYSLRNVRLFSGTHGIPELLAVLAVVLLHFWKGQMLLSIAGGTILYMVLVQMVF